MTAKSLWWAALGGMFLSVTAHGAHPLVTDDSGTVGRGGRQLELGVARARDQTGGTLERVSEHSVQLVYGARENLDVSFAMPWTHRDVSTAGGTSTARGIGDVALGLKWRFWESEAASMALIPKVLFATGDADEDLGTGRTGYLFNIVLSTTAAPTQYNVQIGYLRNENKTDERRDIGSASFSLVRNLSNHAKLAVDLGVATNTDKSADGDPAFLLVGFMFAVRANTVVDVGYQKGISRPAIDRTLLAGLTVEF